MPVNDYYLTDNAIKMKKIISVLVILVTLISCKEEVIEKPNHLIAKESMVNIMYDLSILEAMKYQNPNSLEVYKTDPSQYIYEKYKIDSVQFAQSNKYYASDYKEYKNMFDKVSKRLEQNKAAVDYLIKVENKKKKKAIPIKTPLPAAITEIDSLKKKPTDQVKFTDSKWPLYTDEYLKIPYLKRF